MRHISGNYIENNKAVPFEIDVPSKWDELERYQFARIIEVLHYRKADKFTISVSLLALLCGSKNWKAISSLPPEYQHELVPLTNFLFEEQPPIKNFFPELKIHRRTCAAPDEDLYNLSFGEWCFAHQTYLYYTRTGDIQWLNKLIAILYRPIDPLQKKGSPEFSGDVREKFNENLIEKRAKDTAALASHMKLGVLAWFTCALKGVTALRPHVFPAPNADQPNESEFAADPDEGRNWFTIFRELLGPKWGTPEQLKNTNAMFVLDELEDRHIAFEEAKSKS